MDTRHRDIVEESASVLTYGMSSELRESGLLGKVRDLSHDDKACLIRYLHETDAPDIAAFEDLDDNQQPYTLEELNARIDEAEAEAERGGGKTFEEMMNGFREKLLWLK
jgi:hypothetical protein